MTKERQTVQKQVILEELCSTSSHPTADEVYGMVRERIPNVSLGTVYRNLERMSESGKIQKIESGGGPRRYDGNATKHVHVRCQRCGRVADVGGDVGLPPLSELLRDVDTDFMVDGIQLMLLGLCPQCRG